MSVKALVDCRATGDFIDSKYIISRNLPVQRLSQPILVLNVDGTPNQAGSISSIVNMVVDYKGHAERIQLTVTQLSKQHVILSWNQLAHTGIDAVELDIPSLPHLEPIFLPQVDVAMRVCTCFLGLPQMFEYIPCIIGC
jgi:hypothetical protein